VKKQALPVSIITAYVMAHVLSLSILCPNSSAQTAAPNAQQRDVWELNYMVTFKGKFHVKQELGSGAPDVIYKIDRTYEGKSRLVFAKSSAEGLFFEDLSTTEVTIHIDDTREEIGDTICDEYPYVTERWSGDMSTSTGDPKYRSGARLLINNRTRRYATFFQLFYVAKKTQKDILYRKIELLQSKGGGVKLANDPVVQRLRYLDYGDLPSVKGYVNNYDAIVHTPDWSDLKRSDELSPASQILTLDMQGNTPDRLFWISEPLHPDEPLIEGVPESKDQVTVIVKYGLTRIRG
jgi:hypothetical protein